MNTPLYDLEPEYASLADLPSEIPVTSDEEQRLGTELAGIRHDIGPKLLSLAKVVRTLDAEADLLEQHGRALLARADMRRLRAEYLKRWMQLQMEAAGLDRLRDPFVTVWLQKSPLAVKVVDEAAVPPEFKRAVLRLPYALVPTELRGFVQHLDIERAAILEQAKRTGEVPDGVAIWNGARHIRLG